MIISVKDWTLAVIANCNRGSCKRIDVDMVSKCKISGHINNSAKRECETMSPFSHRFEWL